MINFIKVLLNRRKAKIAARNELCDNTIARFESLQTRLRTDCFAMLMFL